MENTTIVEDGFGFVPRPDPSKPRKSYEIVRRYTMTNRHKASVQLISWGAGIQSIRVPNKFGVLGDVALGFDDMDGYLKNAYTGSIIGRVASCICNDDVQINDKVHSLTIKDNNAGLDSVNWQSHILNKHVEHKFTRLTNEPSMYVCGLVLKQVMSHLYRVNNGGYSGDMLTQVKYTWTDDNQLHINIRASATQATPLNITSHCLLNLAGHGTGPEELRKHVVTINADSSTFLKIKGHLPTGAIRPFDSTVYDLRLPTQISGCRLYSVPGGGYDHNLSITSPSCWCYRFHARILHPGSGRTLEIYSNQPGLQFYTGNDLPDPNRTYPPDLEEYLDNCENSSSESSKLTGRGDGMEIRGKNGVRYRRHGGFVLSPQNDLNAVDTEDLSSCTLQPGKIYVHDMTYKFGVLTKV